MCWRKRNLWKAGIAIAGVLLFLLLMIWIPLSAADAYERSSTLTAAVTVTVQATPTEDATVTALNKEKLIQEVQQLQSQNASDFFGWLRMNSAVLLSTLVVVIGGLIGLFRWFGDRRREREKQAEERFQKVVEGFGGDKEEAHIAAANTLRTFLRPDYKQFYRQAFDLAVAYLRLSSISHPSEDPDGIPPSPEDPNTPLTLTPLNQALIAVFTQAFPLARDWIKQGSPSSRLQRITAWLKRILRREKLFDPRSLDASGIHLDNAFLWKADLEQVYMPRTTLTRVDLSEARLGGAWLWRSDLRWARLRRADLRRADLGQCRLSEADLCDARLHDATLWGADLSGADLHGAQFKKIEQNEHEPQFLLPDLRKDKTGAMLQLADLHGANLSRAHLEGAALLLADLSGADLSGAHLDGADLSGANLSGANLSGVDLSQVKLKGILLSGTHLTKDKFTAGDLSQVKLAEFKLTEVNLNEDLREDLLNRHVLSEADRESLPWKAFRDSAQDLKVEEDLTEDDLDKDQFLLRTDLRGVKGLTKEQLEACKAKGAIVDQAPTSISSQSTVSPSPSSQSNGTRAQPPLSAQGSILTPYTEENSAPSSNPTPSD